MSKRFIAKSPWILHLHGGGCNGCDIEILSLFTPRYDVERLGCLLKNNPRHADVILVTGPITKQVKDMLKMVYEQVLDPKVVVAVGTCAMGGGVFVEERFGNYAIEGSADKVVPVDVYIPGCPPRPETIMYGIRVALEKLSGKD